MSEGNCTFKTYKTVDEQIEYLKENKKIIVPEEYRYTLVEQNYVSLINAYKEFFACGLKGPKQDHVYKNVTRIEQILEIFELDKNIEQVLYELIGDFERHLKNVLIQELCTKYTESSSPDEENDVYCISYIQEIEAFYNEIIKYDSTDEVFNALENGLSIKELNIPKFCKNIFMELRSGKYIYNRDLFVSRFSLIQKIYFYGGGKNIENPNKCESKNELIRHYIKTQKYVPMWVLPNALTFGELQILFTMLDSYSQQHIISKLLDYDSNRIRLNYINVFSSYLEIIRNLRNIVNHYEPIIPYFIGKITDKKIENSQIVKALNVLLNNFYRNKDKLKTTLYQKPNLIDNGYNSRRIKIVTTIYNVLNARQSDSDKEESFNCLNC